ncbi:MAG: 3-oxoacyl-[acyl-carrier-protein] reductase FabG [Alphaproteobacteria bacterium MarineAlpha11_Bin1]|nr:MAG: 3-oxoacyl-[acyl-carrier-protein] reductase FabG [Alphaproteobacteria bacterium MarineAlpha11_Bin1]|tara:strand:- start:2552 stop:3292 length:741 start_codon:yes stop_codon:yes gene_type:complete
MTEILRTLILTGASRGIGHATVRRFSEAGWRIITCSRDDLPEAYPDDPNWAHHIPTDLGNADELTAFIEHANQLIGEGGLSALVNNAAMSPKTPYKERLGCLNGDEGAWREVFDLNFFVPLKLCRGFAAALHRGKGAVVNITSIAGHRAHPYAGSAYSVSKAALSSLTRELAVEFAELDVRVNAVAPGEIETEMIGPEYESLLPRIPLNRMGSAAEVAGAVLQLCTSDFGYVTGTELFVTGGQHLL